MSVVSETQSIRLENLSDVCLWALVFDLIRNDCFETSFMIL